MKSYLLSGSFWAQTAERSIKTFAQAAIALLTGEGLGLLTVNVPNVVSVAGLAAVVSVLTSISSGPFGPGGSPNLVPDRFRTAGDRQAAAALIPTPAPTPTESQPAGTRPAEPAGTGG